MSKYTIDEIFKSTDTKHSLVLFDKKLISSINLYDKNGKFGSGIFDKRADIVVLQKDLEHPFIIVEVKKPNRKDGIEQLKSYCNAEGSPIGVWTNGSELVILIEKNHLISGEKVIDMKRQNLQRFC